MPPADLEAVAASIDQTLSLEAGKMIPRTAWAGRPPDGVIDALMFWMPSVKANRLIWERGQALWAERMTAALSGPCTECSGAAMLHEPPGPAQTIVQTPEDAAPSPGRTEHIPYDAATSAMPGTPQIGRFPGATDADESATSVVPAYSEYGSVPHLPGEDAPTSAVPTYGSSFGAPPPSEVAPEPPAPAADEHESHTVILSAMPSLRTATRLVVVEGPVRGRQFSLGRERTTIGRSIGCHVTIDADSVAYDHARIVRTGEAWQVELAGAATELYVNDQPVHGSHGLRPGDIIRIGPAQLRFESVS